MGAAVPRAAARRRGPAPRSRACRAHPSLAEIFTKLAEGHAVEGMESLTPVLTDDMELLVDLLPERARRSCCATPNASGPALPTSSRRARSSCRRRGLPPRPAPKRRSTSARRRSARSTTYAWSLGLAHTWFTVSPFGLDTTTVPGGRHGGRRGLPRRHHGSARGHPEVGRRGQRVVFVAPGHGQAQRTDGSPRTTSRRSDDEVTAPTPGVVQVACGELDTDSSRRRWLGGPDVRRPRRPARRRPGGRKMPARRRKQVDPLELKAGDSSCTSSTVSAATSSSMQRVVQGAAREYLVIEYAPGKRGQPADRLFVPMDQLDQISRYVGGESPSLDKLGGATGRARKNKARKAVRQIAGELIKLYAARQATKGHAFGPDTPWQAELEDAFAFVETPDQMVDDRRGQARHGAHRADGPAGLRRRRLRQDRDRGARGVQGDPGRQAGHPAGPDDAARAAALTDVRRAVRPVPGHDPAAVALPDRQGVQGDARRVSPTARSTWSSARTACCSPA